MEKVTILRITLAAALWVSWAPGNVAGSPENPDPNAAPENYCHNPETTATWERMFKDSPEDPIVVKLYSLRKGLCAMIDEGKISFEFGSALWNAEHARSVLDRAQDEAKRKREIGA
jgi:hypothetical protein